MNQVKPKIRTVRTEKITLELDEVDVENVIKNWACMEHGLTDPDVTIQVNEGGIRYVTVTSNSTTTLGDEF